MQKLLLLVILCVFLAAFLLQPVPLALADEPPCSQNPVTTAILNDTDYAGYIHLLKSLSGEQEVTIAGETGQYIYTRFAPAMAANSTRARAIPWMLEQLNGWLQPPQIEQDSFRFTYNSTLYTTQNLIATIPGTLHPEEVVILSAHFDSITYTTPLLLAPGAEDNASGSAALLEAARILRSYRFDRTLKLIWFNAEEEGLLGSKAYVTDHPVDNIIGVVNLDMFGYDSDHDGCFELHVGTLEQSQPIGQCFAQTIQSNSLPLTYDYLTDLWEGSSDHETFWNHNVGAVEVLENYTNQALPGGCSGQDRNPNYHKSNDYTTNMDLPITYQIARAGIATAANLAGPLGICYETLPAITFTGLPGANLLSWEAPPQAANYQLERSETGCDGSFTPLGSTTQPEWWDGNVAPGQTLAYRLQVTADASRGFCVSAPLCTTYTAPEHFLFLPALSR